MCQAFQARGIVRFGFSATIKPIMEELLRQEVNIVQMPCPEARLGGYRQGLKREPKGIFEYDTPNFRAVCEQASDESLEMIKAIIDNGFTVIGILGMEYSPFCSIELQYTGRGTMHRPGLYIEALQKKLRDAGIEIPFIGVNRRGIKSTLDRIRRLFEVNLFNVNTR